MNRALAIALLCFAFSVMPSAKVSDSLSNIQTVFVIIMENHDWAEIEGNSTAPYINTILLPRAAHAERYNNPPAIHPSPTQLPLARSGPELRHPRQQ